MSLTAHPYVVLAEQQWKQHHLGGANLAPHHHGRGQGGASGRGGPVVGGPGRIRAWVHLVADALRTQRHAGSHTARPV